MLRPKCSASTPMPTMCVGRAVMQQILLVIRVDVVHELVMLLVLRVQVAGSAPHMDLATHHITNGLAITHACVAILLHLGACGSAGGAGRVVCAGSSRCSRVI